MSDTSKYKSEIDALGKILAAVSELSPEGQAFALKTAAERLSVPFSKSNDRPEVGAVGAIPLRNSVTPFDAANMTPKQFLGTKRPETDVEKVACLAYFLTHNRSTPHFKTADISAINVEAAQKPFSNASNAMGNAEVGGYLTGAGKRGNKQITEFGEQVVSALPDREAVKSVQETEQKRHARKKSSKKPAKPKK